MDFDGVYMNATVYCNGHRLGTRPYGYISFSYDLTPYLRFGERNVVASTATYACIMIWVAWVRLSMCVL